MYPENNPPSKLSLPLESGFNFDSLMEINLFGIKTTLKFEFITDIIDIYDIIKTKITITAWIVVFNIKIRVI